MEFNNVYCGDCYELLGHIQSETIDVIYMDPPFFTQETQTLSNKEGVEYSFADIEYIQYIHSYFPMNIYK